MKSRVTFSGLVLILAICIALTASAVEPPGILNHQGRIAVSGANYTGTGHFKFALVDAAGTGTLWSNDGTGIGGTQPTAAVPVSVSQGHYALGLGDTTLLGMAIPIPASTFTANSTVRLRVWFSTSAAGPFEQLAPDRRITSAGYALSAARAEFAQAAGMITTGVVSNPSFFGTTNLDPLDLSVNNQRALRLEIQSAGAAPNLIGGFSGNSIAFGADGAVIGGGGSSGNVNSISADGDAATISGGSANTASNVGAVVGGGLGNTASAFAAVVAGGQNNTAGASRSAVGGGLNNAANAAGAVVSGGSGNVASGISSTVPGGENNTASQLYSFAAGRRAKALNPGAFVWADSQDSDFASTAGNQFNVRAGGGVRMSTGGTGLALDSDLVAFSGSTQAGRFGGAAGFDFNTIQNVNGVLIEQGTGESAGIFMDGDSITMWSPGDNNRLLRIFDEDEMSPTAVERFYIDGSGGLFSAGNVAAASASITGNVTAGGAVISGTTQTASLNVGSGTFSSGPALHVLSSFEPTMVVESALVSSPGILIKNAETRWFTGIDRPSKSWVVIQNGAVTRLQIDVNGDIFGKSFNPTSDRNAKENFAPVNPRQTLEQVAALPITRWNYKGDTDTHIGPVAQDFHGAFRVGPDDKHIATVDADGVALAAIQGLNLKLEDELKSTRAENAALKERLERLERAVEAMQRPPAAPVGPAGSTGSN